MSSLFRIVMRFLSIAALVSIAACQTTYKKQTTGVVPPYSNMAPIQKEGSKDKVAENEVNHNQVATLYQKLLDLSLSLQGQDRTQIEEIEIPAANNSLEQAVLVLFQLRDLNDYLALQPAAKTEDLYSNELEGQATLDVSAQKNSGVQKVETPTLQNAMLAIQVDLAETLVNNMFLRNVTTYKLVKSILTRSSDSAEYRDSLNKVITDEANNWAALVPSLIHTANNNDDDPEAELADKEPSIEEDSEITFGPGDVEFADTVLMYSQKLADKGEFKKQSLK